MAGWPPAGARAEPAAAGLAGLAEHSLLTAITGPDGTRYRALETIRQYGAERLARRRAGRGARQPPALVPGPGGRAGGRAGLGAGPTGRAAFDQRGRRAARRAGLGGGHDRTSGPTGTGSRSAWRRCASRAACRARPSGGTSRRPRSPLTTHAAASALHDAAAAAEIRHFGGDAMRLHRACADAALDAGDRPRAAYHLAQAAELVDRAPGLMPESAAGYGGPVDRRGRRARPAATRPRRRGWSSPRGSTVPAGRGERRAGRARYHAGPPGRATRWAESAALDLQTSIQVAYGDIAGGGGQRAAPDRAAGPAAAAGAWLRIELFDAYQMAAETAVAAGDLAGRRKLAEEVP